MILLGIFACILTLIVVGLIVYMLEVLLPQWKAHYKYKYETEYWNKYVNNMESFLEIQTFETLNEPARRELELLHKGELPLMAVKFPEYPDYVIEKVGETFKVTNVQLVQVQDMDGMMKSLIVQAKRRIVDRISFKVEKFPVPESDCWEFIVTTTIAIRK